MDMEEKNKIVTQYLYNTFSELKQLCTKDKGYFINEDKYKRALDMFLNYDEDIDTIIKMIDSEKKKLLDSYYNWEEQERQAYLNQFENKTEENEKLGITLNKQMIELMMIATASSIEELRDISANTIIFDTTLNNVSITLDSKKTKTYKFYRNILAERLFPQTSSELWASSILNLLKIIITQNNTYNFSAPYIIPTLTGNHKTA